MPIVRTLPPARAIARKQRPSAYRPPPAARTGPQWKNPEGALPKHCPLGVVSRPFAVRPCDRSPRGASKRPCGRSDPVRCTKVSRSGDLQKPAGRSRRFPRGGPLPIRLRFGTEVLLRKRSSVSGRPLQWGRSLTVEVWSESSLVPAVSRRSAGSSPTDPVGTEVPPGTETALRPTGSSAVRPKPSRQGRHGRPSRSEDLAGAPGEPGPEDFLSGAEAPSRLAHHLTVIRHPPVGPKPFRRVPFPEPKHRLRECKATTSFRPSSTQIRTWFSRFVNSFREPTGRPFSPGITRHSVAETTPMWFSSPGSRMIGFDGY